MWYTSHATCKPGTGSMQGIAGISQAMSSTELAMAYQVRVVALQKDAINAAGQAAVQLIQSAMNLPAGQGANLDIRA